VRGAAGLPAGEAYHDIGVKLRLTAAVLACASRKDFCARFRAVNPATHCDLDRLHKWMQGRALPRDLSFYDDWAKVLGLAQSGAWLAACPVEAFRGALRGPDGALAEVPLVERASRSRGPASDRVCWAALGCCAATMPATRMPGHRGIAGR
jgi:hypothetical protein